MNRITRRIFIALATLVLAPAAIAADEIDQRVLRQLNELGIAYQIDQDNDFAIIIEFDDNRSQLIFVRSEVFSSRGLGMRDIWSDGFRAEGQPMPAGLETRLLKENVDLVMGAWARENDRIAYMVKIPEDAPAEVLRSALLEVAEYADELEKELVGTDDL